VSSRTGDAPSMVAADPARRVQRQATSWVRGALGRVPRVAWACALVALANGLAWSLIVPPFQVPDENAHYAYVQQVAERGTLPRIVSPEGPLSPREDQMLNSLITFGVAGHPENAAPDTDVQQRVIEATADQNLSALGSGDALSATNNPPLYYMVQAIPYRLTPGGKVLDKLQAMRFVSALMGAVTVLLSFMFVRELLPGRRWAWPVGALLVAFQPLFGFMSGGVNNDDLLYLTATGVLWATARAFRRGLTPSTGALIGGFLGAGLVSKLNMIGFIPAVALAVVLLARRTWSRDRRLVLGGAAWAFGLGAAPIALYVLLNHVVWGRGAIPGGVGSVPSSAFRHFSIREEVSHVWQLFLPRLWLRPQFSYSPIWETWFKGLIGRFGWLDYGFPGWVYQLARVVCLVVLVLAVAEMVRRRGAVRARIGELCVYALAAIGLCAEIGVQSYRYLIINGGVFEQARYLLPLVGLYAAVGVLAVRFGGRRWGPVLGAALVMLAIGHDLYAQAITIARYYA
jgi:4-amino-4-deoxy-L-arabinose transferase-like glycosyltransferase